MTGKRDLRNAIRQQRLQHPAADESVVAGQLAMHPRIAEAHTLLLYSTLPDEVPTQQLLDLLTAAGKTVVLPRVVSATDMELRRYTGRGDLQPGAFGIMEPTGALFDDYGQIDVAVVPGMAFDNDGHRLGRGKGYYDRFLRQLPSAYKLGLCFSWQLVDHVPTDEHDIPMDDVVAIRT